MGSLLHSKVPGWIGSLPHSIFALLVAMVTAIRIVDLCSILFNMALYLSQVH